METTFKRALVLGGGGVAGIAWETGVLCGIADESPATAKELLNSAVLVGTSAGSAVAAQLGSGLELEELFARQLSETTSEIDPGAGGAELDELFIAAITAPNTTTAQKLQGIGAVALAAQTIAAPVRRGIIADRLPSHDWPDRTLRITAIDIDTGELMVFDGESGVELVDAVAASCAVPGAWPPVVIGARRYMDGGVRSTINLDVAADCDEAVLLVPTGGGVDGEIDAYRGRVCAVLADGDALRAFGDNPLDPACRAASARAGRDQGRRQAAAIAEFLG
ncbi:patatin-like phospholipase family protein [[Mycobacterium] kokjensenii]|uniref:Patatin-like phospholipase family protein n=1 Tax=[Mycobacterium] kokjensenii TaxID=3064287 RepID=A0ABN9MTT8_9MYCO|nr:patatin-like phospholipase family protein [Mycolicibacter sp. MU0083]CAJ1494843.1 patatin-like phospholipase family protein [Mycolicibacter sp. MU0083]